MAALIFFLLSLGGSIFKSKSRLEAENAALRQQLIVLQRKTRGRVQFTNSDRLFFIPLYRWFPSVLSAITTIRPETLVRWHRAGFRRYWRWKSRNLGGRGYEVAKGQYLIVEDADGHQRRPTWCATPHQSQLAISILSFPKILSGLRFALQGRIIA